jgi:hypothetical protein
MAIEYQFEFTVHKNIWANFGNNEMRKHNILQTKDGKYLIGNISEKVFINIISVLRHESYKSHLQSDYNFFETSVTIKHLTVDK